MVKNKELSIFLFTHLVIWTIVPAITNQNLPLDTIEHIAWGSNLDWGFRKHPPFVAVPLKIFFEIFGNQDWAFYFLSQIFVVSSFYFMFLFSKDILGNNQDALISVVILETIFYYNFTTPEFNVNVVQLPFWALTIFLSYKFFKNEKNTKYLVALGICGAIGLLSKYLFIYLLFGLKFYFLNKIYKNGFKFIYILPGLVLLACISPHLNWLLDNNFSTISYALKRAGQEKDFVDHIYQPIIFILKQVGILSLLFLSLLYLYKKIKFKISFKDNNLLFLFSVVIVPLVFVLLTSLILGSKIRTMWMTPFYLGIGTFCIYIIKNKFDKKNLKKIYILTFLMIFVSSSTYAVISIYNQNKRTDYKGKEVSKRVQKMWDNWAVNNNLSNKKIVSIYGDEWFAGNLIYNLKDKPSWFDYTVDKYDVNIDYIKICNENKICLKLNYKNLK